MTEPKSLREEFTNQRIEAANQYLINLADNLKEELKKGKIQYTKEEAHMDFETEALKHVTMAEIRQTEGYARLNAICARPEIDLCLAEWPCYFRDDKEMFGKARFFVERPYSQSDEATRKERDKNEHVVAAKEQWTDWGRDQPVKGPGLLRRFFSRRNNRTKLPRHGGWVQSSPLSAPVVYEGKFDLPPSTGISGAVIISKKEGLGIIKKP